ncbi:MAG TPA: glutaredoxin family protein [Ktedonobacterales bacterium]|nr:glutaredoxin family protein [Ktedonobacterales bacterium]
MLSSQGRPHRRWRRWRWTLVGYRWAARGAATRWIETATLRTGTPMHVVTLYAKAGCHLCDEARAYLEDALADLSQNRLDLREIDIRSDPALFERYRYRIPVITVDGVERLEGRIFDDAVRELLRSLP